MYYLMFAQNLSRVIVHQTVLYMLDLFLLYSVTHLNKECFHYRFLLNQFLLYMIARIISKILRLFCRNIENIKIRL